MPLLYNRVRVPVRIVLLAAIALSALLFCRARAQTPATFAYQPAQLGWNLLSFLPPANAGLGGPIYTWRPGAHNYDTPTSQTVGAGYWAYHRDSSTYLLPLTDSNSVSVSIPGGQCAMVGNPSNRASARVIGSSRTYVFSTVLNTYVQENLLGIGRGAWACNDGGDTATVTVVDRGDVVAPSWPDCCAPKPISNGGLARVIVHNDSPYPLIASAREIDPNGDSAPINGPDNNRFAGVNNACGSCPEYADGNHGDCSPNATARTYNLAPGTYTLHLQSEGPAVPDLLAPVIEIDGNTTYDACWFIDPNRKQLGY